MVSSAPKGLPAETAGPLGRVTLVFVTRAEASAPRGPLPVWTGVPEGQPTDGGRNTGSKSETGLAFWPLPCKAV